MKIKVNEIRPSVDFGGNVLLSLVVDKSSAQTVRSEYDGLKAPYAIEVKKWTDGRSLAANAYAWTLMDKIAVKQQISKTEVYRQYVKEIGGNNDVVCVIDKAVDRFCERWERQGMGWVTDVEPSRIDGCTNVRVYYGSSTYDREQMARLIELIVQDCKELGIDTMTPQERESLLNDWRAK